MRILFLLLLPVLSFSQLQVKGRRASFESLYSHPAVNDEFVGPFTSWVNAKTAHGATGNGVADDTDELQAAINAVGSTYGVIYLPAGTYKISATLNVNYKQYISIIGEDPINTKIIWAGATNGTMLHVNGTWFSRFNRLTWDAGNSAAICIDQSWDGNGYFDTGNEYADNIYKNCHFGVKLGFNANGASEVSILRSKFSHCDSAGVATGNYNSLDVWVWHSTFDTCYTGVTNAFGGAGNFRVYNNNFRSSQFADVYIGSTNDFSVRGNVSTNSKKFINAGFNPNASAITIQGNTVIDPVDNACIFINNQGGTILLDNIIRSRVSATAPVVFVNAAVTNDGNIYAKGNTFTIPSAIQADVSLEYSTTTTTRLALTGIGEQTLPGFQVSLSRKTFEVLAGAPTSAIQAKIDSAAAYRGQRPVVHITFGVYNITGTLTIPAGSDVQIVGDGYGTILQRSGGSTSPLISIAGPTKSTLRDLKVNGNATSSGIYLSGADQIGASIYTNQLNAFNGVRGVLVNGLDHAVITMHNSTMAVNSLYGVDVIGGSLANAGTPSTGRTVWYGSGINRGNRLTNGGNLLIRDIWNEDHDSANQFILLQGKGIFTVEASRLDRSVSPYGANTLDYLLINNFQGKATFLGNSLSEYVKFTGNNSSSKFLGLANNSDKNPYISDLSSTPGDFRSFQNRYSTVGSGSTAVANVGTSSDSYFVDLLSSIRLALPSILSSTIPGITDFRIYRVYTQNCKVGLELTP